MIEFVGCIGDRLWTAFSISLSLFNSWRHWRCFSDLPICLYYLTRHAIYYRDTINHLHHHDHYKTRKAKRAYRSCQHVLKLKAKRNVTERNCKQEQIHNSWQSYIITMLVRSLYPVRFKDLLTYVLSFISIIHYYSSLVVLLYRTEI
jgi:hypothetical protein